MQYLVSSAMEKKINQCRSMSVGSSVATDIKSPTSHEYQYTSYYNISRLSACRKWCLNRRLSKSVELLIRDESVDDTLFLT